MGIMTEKQARERLCCGPDQCGKAAVLMDGRYRGATVRLCEPSTCMAWTVTRLSATESPRGYCGLAFRPTEPDLIEG